MSPEDFAVDDFKLALSYLEEQFSRLWQRFNFFLSVQTALFGFLGWLAFDKGNLPATRFACFLGIAVAALWYVVSAQDRALVEVYRGRAKQAAERIAKLHSLGAKDYDKTFVGAEATSRWRSIDSWYWSPLSITRLPVWLSLFLVVVWLVLMLNAATWLQSIAAGGK
jgi:hypothetical protein